MRKSVKILSLVLILMTTTACKDKTQMILYDYSHKELTVAPEDSDESEVKRILREMRGGFEDGRGGGGGSFDLPEDDE